MEVFDDWGFEQARVAPAPNQKSSQTRKVVDAQTIRAKLASFKSPPILEVLCYRDVGYPWVQVVFDEVISPTVAQQVGKALVEVAGEDGVYFNSLRPKAVYFLLSPGFADSQQEFGAERYGVLMKELEAWPGPAKTPARTAAKKSFART